MFRDAFPAEELKANRALCHGFTSGVIQAALLYQGGHGSFRGLGELAEEVASVPLRAVEPAAVPDSSRDAA